MRYVLALSVGRCRRVSWQRANDLSPMFARVGRAYRIGCMARASAVAIGLAVVSIATMSRLLPRSLPAIITLVVGRCPQSVLHSLTLLNHVSS